jgi:hypothetical protein
MEHIIWQKLSSPEAAAWFKQNLIYKQTNGQCNEQFYLQGIEENGSKNPIK